MRLKHCGVLAHMVKLNEFKHTFSFSRPFKFSGITPKIVILKG